MKKYILPLLLLLSLGIAACRKCEDPCLKKSNAEFVIETPVKDRWFIGDTVTQGYAQFRALHEADSFVWKIGARTIRGASFIQDGFPEDTWIPVTLITYRQPQLECDPNDDGIDTFTRTFYVWPINADLLTWPDDYYTPGQVIKYLPILGHYRGYLESNPTEFFEVMLHDTIMNLDTVRRNTPSSPSYCDLNMNGTWAKMNILTNIPYKGVNTLNTYNVFPFLYSEGPITPFALYAFYGGNAAARPECHRYYTFPRIKMYAWLERSNRRHITIDYEYQDTLTQEWRKDIFHGQRIYN